MSTILDIMLRIFIYPYFKIEKENSDLKFYYMIYL